MQGFFNKISTVILALMNRANSQIKIKILLDIKGIYKPINKIRRISRKKNKKIKGSEILLKHKKMIALNVSKRIIKRYVRNKLSLI